MEAAQNLYPYAQHNFDARYCDNLTHYQRRKTREVFIGDVPLGGSNPIRVQSMTTVDTMDTEGSIAQSIRMIEAGCEYVRITAPSIKEAANLENIRKGLRQRGYNTPLVADIHFTPNAAELAARLVEKVRVNPGNYADRKKFEHIEYTDSSYAEELERIRQRFIPLVKICKEYGTAMRIGTNHGSLSDRILSRYGDTPLGMVESALEFVRICEELNYYNLVISMKASNTQVMVQAYRLLVQQLDAQGLQPYPLHLGVTEAGEGEDGRIKSAVGIGTLLEDGLGDTIRVSLTEEPEYEIPVAKALADRYTERAQKLASGELYSVSHNSSSNGSSVPQKEYPSIDFSAYSINPYQYFKRKSHEVLNIGGSQVPRILADVRPLQPIEMADLKAIGHFYLPALDKWKMNDLGADFVYAGAEPIPFMVANGSRQVIDFAAWQKLDAASEVNKHIYPLGSLEEYTSIQQWHPDLNFLHFKAEDLQEEKFLAHLKDTLIANRNVVGLIRSEAVHTMPLLRWGLLTLTQAGVENPIFIGLDLPPLSEDTFQLYAATDAGGLLVDGLGDGLMIGFSNWKVNTKQEAAGLCKMFNAAAFGILQAARTRMSKTEYISCPSCGRTLFDLQETTAMIRKRTDHLKGVKIGIMGCIVNGPGEMADADYGYVGVGKDRIALYRGQNVVKKSVPSDKAVNELIELIREDGRWIEADAAVTEEMLS